MAKTSKPKETKTKVENKDLLKNKLKKAPITKSTVRASKPVDETEENTEPKKITTRKINIEEIYGGKVIADENKVKLTTSQFNSFALRTKNTRTQLTEAAKENFGSSVVVMQYENNPKQIAFLINGTRLPESGYYSVA